MNRSTFNFLKPPPQKVEQVFKTLSARYAQNPDPWGLDLKKCQQYLEWTWPFYTHYFRVRVHGKYNVANRPFMVVSNHTGQLPFDGLLLTMAFLMEVDPPRILRAMVERFLAGFPFLGEMAAHSGFILGDRQNCLYLLNRKESILVFPEGVKGIAKNTSEFYNLQPFTKGFFRLALQSQTDILPVAVVGAEEAYPFVYQAKAAARWLGLPALPITPLFPFLGLLGLLPLPTPIDIYIGEPFKIPPNVPAEAPDKVIGQYIEQIENQIKEMIHKGLSQRRQLLPLTRPSANHGPQGTQSSKEPEEK